MTFDGLSWLKGVSLSSWRVRHSAVLVLEMFETRRRCYRMVYEPICLISYTLVDVSAPLLKRMVEMAASDEDDDVRLASIRFLSTICQSHQLDRTEFNEPVT
jgi:hypothetical protein